MKVDAFFELSMHKSEIKLLLILLIWDLWRANFSAIGINSELSQELALLDDYFNDIAYDYKLTFSCSFMEFISIMFQIPICN